MAVHEVHTILPPEIGDASAWYGPDLKERSDWIEHLSETEIAEVESAAQSLAKSSFDLTSISSDDFPLPELGPRLRRLLGKGDGGRGARAVKARAVRHWSRRGAAHA